MGTDRFSAPFFFEPHFDADVSKTFFGEQITGKGVFLVKMKNAFDPVKRDHSVNTYSRISTVPQGSERSEPVNGASELSEHNKVERCGASEWSERCERTNIASDRVAR